MADLLHNPIIQTRPAVSRRALLGVVSAASVAAAASAAGLAGCTFNTDADHAGPDAPRPLPFAKPVRTAWVLSSGGPRGFVHVGVVKALDELGLVPDLIVGASAGALVAVLRASGLRAGRLESVALNLKPWQLMRLALGADERFSGAGLANWVRGCTAGRGLHELELPVACVAWRAAAQEAVAFSAGDAGLAVQASSAIEGRFAPVRIRGERYVDPDLHLPLPVRLARTLGARTVLAVDASAYEDKAPAGTEKWRPGDLRKRQLTQPDAALADFVLHPDTGYYAGVSSEYREHSIAIGYRDTMAAADRLRALHAMGTAMAGGSTGPTAASSPAGSQS